MSAWIPVEPPVADRSRQEGLGARQIPSSHPMAPDSSAQRASRGWIWVLGISVAALLQLGFMLVALLVVLPAVLAVGAPAAPAVLPAESPTETLETNNEAWLTANCDQFVATTTEAFRDRRGFTDCDRFRESAEFALDEGTEYHAAVESEEITGAHAVVVTVEVHRDAETHELVGERYLYDLVIVNGSWQIDNDSLMGETEVTR